MPGSFDSTQGSCFILNFQNKYVYRREDFGLIKVCFLSLFTSCTYFHKTETYFKKKKESHVEKVVSENGSEIARFQRLLRE